MPLTGNLSFFQCWFNAIDSVHCFILFFGCGEIQLPIFTGRYRVVQLLVGRQRAVRNHRLRFVLIFTIIPKRFAILFCSYSCLLFKNFLLFWDEIHIYKVTIRIVCSIIIQPPPLLPALPIPTPSPIISYHIGLAKSVKRPVELTAVKRTVGVGGKLSGAVERCRLVVGRHAAAIDQRNARQTVAVNCQCSCCCELLDEIMEVCTTYNELRNGNNAIVWLRKTPQRTTTREKRKIICNAFKKKI